MSLWLWESLAPESGATDGIKRLQKSGQVPDPWSGKEDSVTLSQGWELGKGTIFRAYLGPWRSDRLARAGKGALPLALPRSTPVAPAPREGSWVCGYK